MLVMAAMSFALLARGFAQQATPIVLDTDIGGDIDDAFALALVLASPELNLRAVTTVSGDTQARARIAARMLAEAGRGDVPVAAGEPGSKMDISQAKWGEGFTSASLVATPAADLMEQKVVEGHGRTVLVAIGPLTNVAAFLKKYPQSKGKVKRILLMGGSIARGYYPNSPAMSEYNIAADAKAAQTVFASGIPISMAPLDVTARLQIEGAQLEQVFNSKPLGHALRELYKLWGQPVPTLHDPMAVSLLPDSGLCTMRSLSIEIDDHGMTRVAEGKPANALVATETDSSRFISFYVSRLSRGGGVK